jgi:hypothetical protein
LAEENISAVAAIRALRDVLRNKLDQNEDYRAWKALDEVVRQLEPTTMPRVDFGLSVIGPARATDQEAPTAQRNQGGLSGLTSDGALGGSGTPGRASSRQFP